ncbi:hypothetical protein GCM10011351_00420 [Paraliobacillus quinghaiensis]|uniref:DUF4064 domain-containing protein n=1 Tax=Paraliobacillus quinghaiensis TaxID=470815 RepID=A0A917TCN7_9BACI|nr:DUF4064 domain-containing protein [Paraliobacillus quinghaiensis]GGM18561.1 hypothetical protein GCM10011351_00420 [Paraliobacillus quinghaiensis]
MSRTTEFVLGLIGGILGFFGAILALFIGGVDAAFSETGSSSLTGLGWSAFLFSALAIVGSVVVKSKAKLGGTLLLVSAVGGLISISFFYLISAVLIGIAGIMGLVRKEKKNPETNSDSIGA